MHDLQKQILRQLLLKQTCRYRDIKPKEVEGNLFMYHLRRLISDGLVEKSSNRYQLTKAGLRFVDTVSLENLRPRIQPKIATLLIVKNNSGQYLLYRRSREPFFGKTGFPYGKIHLGETIAEAANRELQEKTGLQASLNHRGDAYVTVYQGNELLSHMLFHIFAGSDPAGQLKADSEIGRCFWGHPTKIAPQDLFPGLGDIFRTVDKTNRVNFFREFSYQI
jgi:ADP-ribose pyrophosphatase